MIKSAARVNQCQILLWVPWLGNMTTPREVSARKQSRGGGKEASLLDRIYGLLIPHMTDRVTRQTAKLFDGQKTTTKTKHEMEQATNMF